MMSWQCLMMLVVNRIHTDNGNDVTDLIKRVMVDYLVLEASGWAMDIGVGF